MKHKKETSLRVLMGGASIMMIALAVQANTAVAQDAAAPKADDSTVVVVTGQRAQLKSAQKIKKDSPVIVDSVTAVDIGALPDRSVSEALQRISGLTLERTDNARDPARLAVEGGNVEIRGLSWVKSETNGHDIFSANNGRALSFDDISADLLSGVNVYKNPSADMIEGGIGGIVDLRTRLPFDSKKQIIALSADSNYGDLDKKPHTSYNGFYSNRWDVGGGEFGLLLDYSNGDVGNRTDSLSLDKFNATSISDGTCVGGVGAPPNCTNGFNQQKNADGSTKIVYIPGSIGWREVTWDAKRTAATVAMQYRPNEEWLLTFNFLDARSRESNLEYALGSYDGSLTSPQPSWGYTYNSQGVLTSGTNPSAGYDGDTRYELDHKNTSDTSFNVKFTPNAKLTLTGDAQYVNSNADMTSLTAYTELATRTSISFSGLQSEMPTIKVNSPNTTGVEGDYYWAATMDHLEHNTGDQIALRLDGDYRFDDSGWLKEMQFGVRATDKHYVTRQTGWNWSLLSNQYWLGNPDTVYINQTGGTGATDVQNAQLPKEVSFQTFGNFFHGAATVPGNVWFPSADLVSHGTAYAYNLLKGTETEGWGWTPLAANAWDSVHPEADNATAGVNRQQEKTAAAYVTGTFGGSSFFGIGSYDGNLGVRYVSTEALEDGAIFAFTAPQTVCNPATTNCTLYNQVVKFSQGTINAPGTFDNKYSDILPSFNLRVHLNDQWQLRFGASRAMVRPDLSQLIAYTTLSVNQNADGTPNTNAVGGAYTGTGGNPNLKPITANQYDLTAEDYFSPTGSITFDLFDKELQNYIYTGSDAETYTANGQTFTFNVTRQFNGFKGQIKGFELAYQQFYDMLPGAWSGLGLQANYTHIDSSGGHNTAVDIFDSNQVVGQSQSLPLEGMSPESYNVAVMYEKYGISARLAYNWRSLYLLTTSGANINSPVWSEAYGQLDGSIFYSLNSHYKIGIQATNLTHAKTILDASNPTNLSIRERYNWIDTDRRVALVLRATF